jgi:short-subunit dehydrogenase
LRYVVAITGASSGIGATFARKLAPEHDLILIARRRDRLEELAAELLARHGTGSEVITADLTAEEDLARVADRILAEPNLALLVNNAGFGSKKRFWEAALETQEAMHKLHVLAPMRLTHAALRNMVPRDFGAVINVSSVASFMRTAGNVSYCATKTWMTTFTEGLYLELQSVESSVTVQALCPGFTYSEFHDTMAVSREKLAPPPFWMSAEEVVQASLDGLAQRKLFVIPGWHYRLLTAIVTQLPAPVRLRFEAASSKRRTRALPDNKESADLEQARDS